MKTAVIRTFWLSKFCAEHRLEKKYLIVPSYQVGHQVGEVLAEEGGSWVDKIFRKLKAQKKFGYFGDIEATTGIIQALRHSINALRME